MSEGYHRAPMLGIPKTLVLPFPLNLEETESCGRENNLFHLPAAGSASQQCYLSSRKGSQLERDRITTPRDSSKDLDSSTLHSDPAAVVQLTWYRLPYDTS